MLELAVDRHLRSAERRRDERERHAGQAEGLVLSQAHAERAEQEAADEHEVQQRADERQRVERAQLGHRQHGRKVEAEHRAEADDAEGRRRARR